MAAPYQTPIVSDSSGFKVKNTFLHVETDDEDCWNEFQNLRRMVTEPSPTAHQNPIAAPSKNQGTKHVEQEGSTEDDKSTGGSGEHSDKSGKKAVRTKWTSSESNSSRCTDRKVFRDRWASASSDSHSSFDPEVEQDALHTTTGVEDLEARPVLGDGMVLPVSLPMHTSPAYPVMMWQAFAGSDCGYVPPRPMQSRAGARPLAAWVDSRTTKRVGRRKSKSLITLAQQAQQRQQELEKELGAPESAMPELAAVPQDQFAAAAQAVQERLAAQSNQMEHNAIAPKTSAATFCPACGGAARAHHKFCQFCGAAIGSAGGG